MSAMIDQSERALMATPITSEIAKKLDRARSAVGRELDLLGGITANLLGEEPQPATGGGVETMRPVQSCGGALGSILDELDGLNRDLDRLAAKVDRLTRVA